MSGNHRIEPAFGLLWRIDAVQSHRELWIQRSACARGGARV